MKRLHVALTVQNLQQSVDFYTALFGAAPTVRKDDYAKWLLDDPRVNLSITHSAQQAGIEHLGIQAENENELQDLFAGVSAADVAMREEGHTTCCYARSEKSWARDPRASSGSSSTPTERATPSTARRLLPPPAVMTPAVLIDSMQRTT